MQVALYRADEWYAPRDDQWSQREVHNTRTPVEIVPYGPLLERWIAEDYGAHKIMCMGEPADIDAVNQFLGERYGAELHLYRSRPTYLEIAAKSISKATALRLVADHLGLFAPEEVVAFGDNYNDIELLELAGRGVAVANAKAEVIEVADGVTGAGKADGVAEEVLRLLG